MKGSTITSVSSFAETEPERETRSVLSASKNATLILVTSAGLKLRATVWRAAGSSDALASVSAEGARSDGSAQSLQLPACPALDTVQSFFWGFRLARLAQAPR